MKAKLPRARVTRSGTATAVMTMIALCAAVLSFGALAEIGNTAARRVALFGIAPPYAGYIWAGCVDWFILLGFLKVEGPKWQVVMAIVHIVLGLAASLTFQLLHADGRVYPIAVAAVPVLAVFLSLDTWAIPKLLAKRDGQVSTPRPGGVPTPAALPPPSPGQGRAPRRTAKGGQPARERVRALLDTEDPAKPWTAGQVATLAGVGRSRAGVLLTEERARRNGDTPA